MSIKKDVLTIAAIPLLIDLVVLWIGITIRWKNHTYPLNMDIIGANAIGLMVGFMIALWIVSQHSQEELTQEREKWVNKNGDLLREIEELKSKGKK